MGLESATATNVENTASSTRCCRSTPSAGGGRAVPRRHGGRPLHRKTAAMAATWRSSAATIRMRRRARQAMGVRTATHHACALSRRAAASARCRAAFIEFNHTRQRRRARHLSAAAGLAEAYPQRGDAGDPGVEMQSPDPAGSPSTGARSSAWRYERRRRTAELKLPNATFRFVKGAADIMSGSISVRMCKFPARRRGVTVDGNRSSWRREFPSLINRTSHSSCERSGSPHERHDSGDPVRFAPLRSSQ